MNMEKTMRIRLNVVWLLAAGLLLLPGLAPPASAQDEGIKVHGAWVIEVRNPDGSLASRTEFQNALRVEGRELLVRMLTRQAVMGEWWVEARATNDAQLCPFLWAAGVCGFAEQFGTYGGTSGPTITLEGDAFRLAGHFTVETAGSLSRVRTGYSSCSWAGRAQAPHCQLAGVPTPFTERELPTPVQVQPGQIVQVTVRISFS
jgi:hypothetical protein